MSQEKVDLYKKNKANRKNASAKEARTRKMEIGIFLVIIIAALAWFIGSIAVRNVNNQVTTTVIDTTAVDDYIYSLD